MNLRALKTRSPDRKFTWLVVDINLETKERVPVGYIQAYRVGLNVFSGALGEGTLVGTSRSMPEALAALEAALQSSPAPVADPAPEPTPDPPPEQV